MGCNILFNKEKKELTQEEKEYKSMRKQIQEKLIKFATRIPILMYLTDYREQVLKDVITQKNAGNHLLALGPRKAVEKQVTPA